MDDIEHAEEMLFDSHPVDDQGDMADDEDEDLMPPPPVRPRRAKKSRKNQKQSGDDHQIENPRLSLEVGKIVLTFF